MVFSEIIGNTYTTCHVEDVGVYETTVLIAGNPVHYVRTEAHLAPIVEVVGALRRLGKIRPQDLFLLSFERREVEDPWTSG